MANGGRIDYTIGFNLDKSGLNQVLQELNKIQKMTEGDLISKGFAPNSTELNAAIKRMNEAKMAASAIGPALQKSFNTRLNTVNLKTFEQEINRSYGSVQKLFSALNKGGVESQQFATKLATGLLSVNTSLRKTETLIDKIGGSLIRTLGWSLSSSVINRVVGAIQNAVGYVEHLDTSLNDIRIVTKKSSDEMANFAVQANEAAKALGKSTTDYTEAALIYYQQGLNDKETAARAATTLKVANVTGQATSTVSEELTAVWNGYKVSANEAEEYIDKLSAVAATTASDLQELSTGMSKVASAANSMGVDIDQLNAQLATIISVTRQAPESVGTALKTIYARMADLTMGATDEDGVDLGKVSSGLKEAGIEILDETGDLRELGDVIEEVADKWQYWTTAQQAAIAQLMAGKRQYNNLVALFDNWGMYEDAIETSQNATGELQRQQDIYMESTKAHLQQLKAQWEDVYDSILDSKTIIAFTDGLKGVLKVITEIIDAFGGGGGLAAHLTGLVGILFSDKMTKGISELINRASDNKMYKEQLDAQFRIATGFKESEKSAKVLGEYYEAWGKNARFMSDAQIQQNLELTKEIGLLAHKQELLEEEDRKAEEKIKKIQAEREEYEKNIQIISEGNLQASSQIEEEHKKRIDNINTEYNERAKRAEEAHQKELERIEEEHQARIAAEKAILEEKRRAGEDAAQQIKNIEKNLADNNSTVPNINPKFQNVRTQDFSASFTSSTLVDNWGTEGTKKIENDLAEIIRVASAADKEIGKLLNKIPVTNDAIKDSDAWQKWGENAKKNIETIYLALDKLKESGKMDDQTYNNLTSRLNNMFTKEGSLSGNISSGTTIEALKDIQNAAKTAAEEVKNLIKLVQEAKDAGPVNESYNAKESSKQNRENTKFNTQEEKIELDRANALRVEQERAINEALNEQKANIEGCNQEEEALKAKTEERKEEEEEIGNIIKNQTELKKKQQKEQFGTQATINSAFNLATGMTSLINSGKTIENLTKSIANGSATIATSISQIGSFIFTTTSGISALGKLVNNLGSSSITILSKIGIGLQGVMGALGPIAATIGVIYALVKIYQGAVQGFYDNLAKDAEDVANAQEKIVDNLKEEKVAIDELANSYQNILKTRDENGKISDEQKSQIYELVTAYGDEELMLLALAEDYDKLNQKIKEKQNAKNENLIDQSKFASKLYSNSLKANIEKNADESERDDEGYDFTDAELLHNWSADLGALIGKDSSIIDSSGHIRYDDLTAILTSDEKALNEFIREYSDLDATKQILKLLSEEESTISKLKETKQDIDEYLKQEKAEAILQSADLSTLQGYQDAINQTIEKFKEENIIDVNSEESVEEGKRWIANFFRGVKEESANFDQVVDLVDIIFPNPEDIDPQQIQIFTDKLGALTSSQLAEVARKTDLIKILFNKGKTAEEVYQAIEAGLKEVKIKDHSIDIEAVLSGSSKKKIKESIDELFSDNEFEIKAGISKESFLGMDKGLQQSVLVNMQFEEDETNVATFDERKAQIEEENRLIQEEYDKQREIVNNTYKQASEDAQAAYDEFVATQEQAFIDSKIYQVTIPNYDDSPEGIEHAKEKYAELMSIIQKAYEDSEEKGTAFSYEMSNAWNNMDQEMKDFYDSYRMEAGAWGEENIGIVKQWGKSWSEAAKAQKDAYDDLIEQEQILNSLLESKQDDIELNIDYIARAGEVQTAITNLNKCLDELQSSYQSLQDVVEDYNEDGYLTLDNLQKILEMDDAYVAALQLENGQLSLNDEAYNNLVQTELHMMEVKATQLYLDELYAIAQGQNVDAAAKLDIANQSNVDSINAVAEAAGRGTEALYKFAAAKAALEKDEEQTKRVTEAYYNRMQLIKNVASQGTSQILSKASKSSSSKSSSEKDPKTEKYLEREEDIYREINEQLKQIESTLGRIQKINDHEWGYDAQVTLEKENELLDLQLNKLEEKKKLQESDLSSRRKQLEDIGVNFSDDGSSMSNAEAVLNGLYAHYNQMVDTYNKMSAAEQETYKETLDAEKERIDKIDKKISGYESLYSEYQSTLDDILDKHFEQIENTVNQFNNMVEVHLELDDAKKEWTDFWYDVVKDVEENNFAEQIAKSMSKLGVLVGVGLKDASGSQVAELTRHTAETVAEVSKQIQSAGSGGNLSIFGDDSKLAYETLKDYRDKLMTALKDAEQEVDHVGEVYLQILDDAQTKIDKQVDGWNAIGDQIQNDIDLITLISGDDTYEALAKQFELQYKNNLELVETQRRSKEYWQAEIDKYNSLLAATKEGSKEWKTYSAALEKSTENFKKAIQDLDSTVKKAIEDLNKWKDSQTKALLDTIDKNLSAGMGLSDLEDEWTLINRYANRYFDQVERSLAMEDVNLTFDKLLDNTNLSIDAQKKLNALREEEVKRLTEKDKLTQYDIDELKARLEITKQQMALEDAQRAKTNLRLRRDSQGNYSYQYTADESDLLSGREGMLSAKKDWYKLVKNNMIELSSDILSIEKEIYSKQEELANTNWENNREGEERLKNEIKQLLEEKLFLEEQYSVGRQQLFKGTAEYFKEVEEAGMFPQWKSTLMQMSNAWYDGGKESFLGTVQDGIQKIEDLDEIFRERHHAILEEAGIDYTNLRDNGIDPTIDALDDLVDTNEELAESLDETNSLLDQQAINLKQVEEAYNALKDAAVEAVESANKVLEELSKTAIETQQQVQASVQAAQNAAAAASRSTSYNRTTGTGTDPTGGSPSSSVNKTDNVLFSAQGYDGKGHSATSAPANARNTRSWIMSAKSTWPSGSVFKVDSTGKRIANVGGWSTRSNGQRIENLTELLKYITTYRSGGYTGTWGGSSGLDDVRSGRLAVLHEKELVLNKDDTKNLLDAVSVLRGISISQVAEGIIAASRAASTAINGVGAGLMQTIAGLTQNVQSGNINTYSRNMTVNADFSGVKSAEAIYQALMELDNYGMQNAYSNAPHMNRAY